MNGQILSVQEMLAAQARGEVTPANPMLQHLPEVRDPANPGPRYFMDTRPYTVDPQRPVRAEMTPLTRQGGSLPRGVRNNNPGNIEYGSFTRSHGATASDGRFAKFDSPEQGIAAIIDLQRSYEDNYGLKTVAQRINRWAPAGGGDGNNPSAYAAAVARAMGISPTQPFSIRDPEMAQKFVAAMIQVENGRQPYTPQQIAAGYQASKTGGGSPVMAYAPSGSATDPTTLAINAPPSFPTNYRTISAAPPGPRRVASVAPPLAYNEATAPNSAWPFLPGSPASEGTTPQMVPPALSGAKAAPVKTVSVPGPPDSSLLPLEMSRRAITTAAALTPPMAPPPAGGAPAAMFNPTPLGQQLTPIGMLGANPPAFVSRDLTPGADLPILPGGFPAPPAAVSSRPASYSPPGRSTASVPPMPRRNPMPLPQRSGWPGNEPFRGPFPVTGPYSITGDYVPASMFLFGQPNLPAAPMTGGSFRPFGGLFARMFGG